VTFGTPISYFCLKKSTKAWKISIPWYVSIPAAEIENTPIIKKRIHIFSSSLNFDFLLGERADHIVRLVKDWDKKNILSVEI
jgi:hypothetical protein